jgi:putative transposase
MKLTAKIKLQPTPDQYKVLLNTLETANAACNDISQQAWDSRIFSQFSLHKLVYHDIRDRFPLSAQMTVRAVAKVADAYKLDKKAHRTFKPHGAFPYDNRILSFQTAEQTVSIWTLAGRQRIPYLCGDRQRELLEGDRGEADLCYINDAFYLFVACEVETPEPEDVDEFLGVDLGIVNLASDSDGAQYSGEQVEDQRRKYQHRRRNLQRKGTRAARRKLRQISGNQQRFQTDTNHRISKRIVQTAQDTGRGIALEDLKGIRDRVTVRRKQRARHANWAFHQLCQFIEYKAQRAGVLVVAVDPRNTSRTCPACGYVDKRNRPNQSTFSCVSCGYSANADTTAAVNIAARAAVNQPNGCYTQGSAKFSSYKLPALAGSS